MKLVWESRDGWVTSHQIGHRYWVLTRVVGTTIGVNTGYSVGNSGFKDGRPFASFPNGEFKFFDTEEKAKNYCEVCCRMGVHK